MELTEVSYGYEPGRAVLTGVTGALAAGRVTALIGPNAAGKTTLLRVMLGQLRPDSGEVRVDGQSVEAVSPGRRARLISYVPQRGLVSFAFTVEQVVTMGRFAARPDDTAIDEALAATDLTEHRARVYQELSAGQQQRVLLARALAQSAREGRVMLLDEPGSAMDLWHVHRMMGTLRETAQRGLAVLVALHDLNLAARYADDVWLLNDGQLAAAGRWDQVLQPAVLEPVYRVGMTPLTVGDAAGGVSGATSGGGRPVFHVEPSAMMKCSEKG